MSTNQTDRERSWLDEEDVDLPVTINLRDLHRTVVDLHTALKPIVELRVLTIQMYGSDIDNLAALAALLRSKMRLPRGDGEEDDMERVMTDGVCFMRQFMYLHERQQKELVVLDKLFRYTTIALREELERGADASAGTDNVLFQYGIHRKNLRDLEASASAPTAAESNPRVLSREDLRNIAESHDIPLTRARQLTPYTWLWSCSDAAEIESIDGGYMDDLEDPAQPRIPLAVTVLHASD